VAGVVIKSQFNTFLYIKMIDVHHWSLLCDKALQTADCCTLEWLFHLKSCSLNLAGKSGWQAPVYLLVSWCGIGRRTENR